MRHQDFAAKLEQDTITLKEEQAAMQEAFEARFQALQSAQEQLSQLQAEDLFSQLLFELGLRDFPVRAAADDHLDVFIIDTKGIQLVDER